MLFYFEAVKRKEETCMEIRVEGKDETDELEMVQFEKGMVITYHAIHTNGLSGPKPSSL